MLINKTVKRIGSALLCLMIIFSAFSACRPAEMPGSSRATTPTAAPTDIQTEKRTEEPTAEPSVEPTEEPLRTGEMPKPPFDTDASILAFHELDIASSLEKGLPDIGFYVDYIDDEFVIFYCHDGVFVYDFNKERITISVDFKRVLDAEGYMQGYGGPDRVAAVMATADGQIIRVSAHKLIPREVGLDKFEETPYDCYYIHLPSATCVRGDFGKFENEFVFDQEKYGEYLYDEVTWPVFATYADLTFTHNGKEYKIFADDSFIVKGE